MDSSKEFESCELICLPEIYVYLAGGYHSDWRDRIKKDVSLRYFDPKEHGLKELDEYGTWDLFHVKKCDIVFGYMERTNPGGFGLAVELGYAKGMGKTVILCLEPGHELYKDRYLSFMRKVADITFENFDDAVAFMKKFEV